MIADIDKDGSGTIDFEEFLQMMTAKMGERDSKVQIGCETLCSNRLHPVFCLPRRTMVSPVCCGTGGNSQGVQVV